VDRSTAVDAAGEHGSSSSDSGKVKRGADPRPSDGAKQRKARSALRKGIEVTGVRVP
jgi:hypothetical protein